MSKEIIKKIVINIAGKEVSVTKEQANELCDALMNLLGRQTYYWNYPYPYYTPTWTISYGTHAGSTPELDAADITIT